MKKNDWSISSEGQIFDFLFLGGVLKKVYIQGDNYCDVYFHLTGTCIKYKMSVNNMVYKKCSSYSFLCLKVSQTSEFYKNTKHFGNSIIMVNIFYVTLVFFGQF